MSDLEQEFSILSNEDRRIHCKLAIIFLSKESIYQGNPKTNISSSNYPLAP